MSYGYKNEAAAPHCWTDIAARCPLTTEWVRGLPLSRLFRVRFMLLEAGAHIPEHHDQETRSLGPINVALSNPVGCAVELVGIGIVPFKAGRAFLIDVSRSHRAVNASARRRYHLIVHGLWDTGSEEAQGLLTKSFRAAQCCGPADMGR